MSNEFSTQLASTISADLVAFLVNNVSLPYVSPTTAVCNLYDSSYNGLRSMQVRATVAAIRHYALPAPCSC